MMHLKRAYLYIHWNGFYEGGPIPIKNRYGQLKGYRKDKQGNTVITKLNEGMLQEIAQAGGGFLHQSKQYTIWT